MLVNGMDDRDNDEGGGGKRGDSADVAREAGGRVWGAGKGRAKVRSCVDLIDE